MNRKIKFGAVASLAVAAVSTVGLANALWADHSAINGQLNSGELSMGWSNAQPTDNDAAFAGFGGDCSAQISEDQKTVNLTIDNAYPGYQCVTNVAVSNNGTVPAKVTNVAFGAHNPAIQMADSGSQVQTNWVLMPGSSGNYRLTVTVPSTVTEAQLAEGINGFSVPVSLDFANALPADLLPGKVIGAL
jgi:hypothetical protein